MNRGLMTEFHKRAKKMLDKVKSIFCAAFRHSNIESICFGYHYCERCGVQVGDTLMGVYENNSAFIIGHNCDTCKENWKKLTFVDKFLVTIPKQENRKK